MTIAVYNHKMKNFLDFNLIWFFAAISPRWFLKGFYFILFYFLFFVVKIRFGVLRDGRARHYAEWPTTRCSSYLQVYRSYTIAHRCSSETTQKAMKYTKNKTPRRKKKKKKQKKNICEIFFTYPYPSSCPFPFTGRFYFFFVFCFLFLGRCEIGRWMHT